MQRSMSGSLQNAGQTHFYAEWLKNEFLQLTTVNLYSSVDMYIQHSLIY